MKPHSSTPYDILGEMFKLLYPYYYPTNHIQAVRTSARPCIYGETVSGNGWSAGFYIQSMFGLCGLEQILYHSRPQFLHLVITI